MSQGPVYEQVSAAKPGQPFTPSGLYKLAGHCIGQRFVRATVPGPLRTMAQWQALARGGLPDESPMRWRCPACLAYLPVEQDKDGQRLPCPQCGSADAPLQVDSTRYAMCFDPPRTLDRVAALRKDPHLVAETTRHPVRARLLPAPPARQTFAAPTDMLGRVAALQAVKGWRTAKEAPLRTMAQPRCERCGTTRCNCPPSAPRVLDAAVTRQKRDLARREAAFEAAGWPAFTVRKG